MSIIIKDMDKYEAYTHKMMVDEIYSLKVRLSMCKMDNRTMRARYTHPVSPKPMAAPKVHTEPPVKLDTQLVSPTGNGPKMYCGKCITYVDPVRSEFLDKANNRVIKISRCPKCGEAKMLGIAIAPDKTVSVRDKLKRAGEVLNDKAKVLGDI